jgi:hypothetical protein
MRFLSNIRHRTSNIEHQHRTSKSNTNIEHRTEHRTSKTKYMEKNHSITHVILTGGVGSRLWPLSHKSQPKQYLDIFDGRPCLK